EESRGRKVYNMAVQIKKAARNLLSIINNILDYSKMEANKMELVEDEYYLEEMVKDTFNLLSIPAMERGLTVNLYLDEELPCKLYGDDGKISQVLINLLNNAIKFTKVGHIDLTVNGSVEGDYVDLIFSVEDTGSGISKENQETIFESFSQVDKINNKSIEGTGLGLSITKGLVDMLGGRIALSSVYGEGSTFSVSLEQRIVDNRSIKEYSIEDRGEQKERRLFVSHSTKVLICDDNKINLLVIEGMLDLYELDVTLSSSGREAIDKVMNEDYDIIMMDHMMPDMDGIETTAHIRTIVSSRVHKPYIIALTANTYEGAREMFLSRGFDDFLPKPVDKIVLYEKLLSIIPANEIEFIEDEIAPPSYTEDDLAELFMEDVDVRKAMENREGNINDYLKVLELYCLEGEDKLKGIRDTYEAKDFKNYEIYVHGLKSTSLSIGAEKLSDMAKAHEFAAKDNNIQFIDGNINKLCEEYDKILLEIQGVLVKKGIVKKVNEEDRLEGMDNNQLQYRLRRILSLSEDFRGRDAYNELEKLLQYRLDKDVQRSLEAILIQFKMYDDDGAEEAIKTLLDNINGVKGEGNE
nr:response regulator [Lachnospiraceae bacterium]